MPKETSQKEKSEKEPKSFTFRIKIGEYEVEISGAHNEVTKTLEDLPSLVVKVHKAFENVKPKTVATLTVKTEPLAKTKAGPKRLRKHIQNYLQLPIAKTRF